MDNAPSDIRRSVVAGRFYPASPSVLRATVTMYLEGVPEHEMQAGQGETTALMVPHAGYVFSGAIAGLAVGGSRLAPVVFVFAPNHTGRGAPFSVWGGGGWETPLGLAPVDRDMAGELCALPGFRHDTEAHLADHAIEVILPFLQVRSPESLIVPVCVGGGSLRDLRAAGAAMAALVARKKAEGRPVTMLVSSDMNHFQPHDVTVAKDALALERIRALDPDGLYRTVKDNRISMCGILPMTMALYAATMLGAKAARVVAHATSWQTGKDFGAGMDSVVGYAGVIIE